MTNQRRQRHKLRLKICTTTTAAAIITSIILQLSHQFNIVECQPSQLSPQMSLYNPAPYSMQYPQKLPANILVSEQIAQSLPLTRSLQQPQSQPDLDNVIESTTLSIANKLDLQQQQPSSNCQLPPTWAGKWYQSNKEPIRITNTEISDKGVCRDQRGDKYLFEYVGKQQQQQQQQQSQTPCLMCLVINERHLNVLQYKESSTCQPIPANYYNHTTNNIMLYDDHALLDSVCSHIYGDAQLESLFRLETPSIECPINGQFSFTYDSCKEPQSSLDSCIDKKQLNFKFSACPDITGSESKSEVLKCYADWSEGNNYYMIGRIEHASNNLDKGKFRCFVYEKSQDGKFIQMAQSLEESCYGLINANEGPKTLRLSAKPPTAHKCHFPSYIQSQSENWLSVDDSLIYMFNQNSTKYQVKETKEGNVIEEATCLQQFTNPQFQAHPHNHHQPTRGNTQQVITNRRYSSSVSSYPQTDQSPQQVSSRSAISDIVYLVQITKNCHTTNYCVRFYKRSNGIVQIDYFNSSPNSDNQCRNAYIGSPQTQIITSTNLEHQRCPFEGAYTIEAPLESDLTYNPSNIFICPRQSFLTAQCDHPSRLRIHSKCSPAKFLIKNLYCLGSWTTSGLVRLLLADDDRHRYSAWYRDYGSLQTNADGALTSVLATTTTASVVPTDTSSSPQSQQQAAGLTRSQHLLLSSNSSPNYNNLVNSIAPVVDLQIALITPLPIVARPMQVRLTRRGQCSELRGYMSQGAYGSPISAGSSSIPPYASSATASSATSATTFILNQLSFYSIFLPIVAYSMRFTTLLDVRQYQLMIMADH